MSQDFDLQPFQATRPTKVNWYCDIQPGQTALDVLKSKSLKQFLKKIDEVLLANNLRVTFSDWTEAEYQNWLPYYEAKMQEHGYRILADADWFKKKTDAGKIISGLVLHQGDTLVGSAVISSNDTKASLAFKASDRLEVGRDTNSSTGAIIDYLFLDTMIKAGKQRLSGGMSRNAFGVHNTLGYLDYKLRFGYLPTPARTAEITTQLPLNEAGQSICFGWQADQWQIMAVRPTHTPVNWEIQRFATAELPFKEITY